MPLRPALLSAVLLPTAACVSGSDPTACLHSPEIGRSAQSLTPGDQIEVIVYSAPELSGTLTVAPDGRLHMPLVGPIDATGRSSPEIEREIMAALKGELRNPGLAVIPLPGASRDCTTP